MFIVLPTKACHVEPSEQGVSSIHLQMLVAIVVFERSMNLNVFSLRHWSKCFFNMLHASVKNNCGSEWHDLLCASPVCDSLLAMKDENPSNVEKLLFNSFKSLCMQ